LQVQVLSPLFELPRENLRSLDECRHFSARLSSARAEWAS
jgi:hypothetical protein